MYILEGNAGVGKTTFLSLVQEYYPEIEIRKEPLDDWNKQIYGQSLLANFYNKPKRWAYTLETLAMICRARDHLQEENYSNTNRIIERSIYSGHYCFAKNSLKNGFLTQLEWNIYNKWVDFLLLKRCTPPLGFIYLKANPDICFKRVQKRNRESEKKLTMEYVEQLDQSHDRFLIQKKDLPDSLKNTPVLVLDCNEEFVENKKNMKKHATQLKEFLLKTQIHNNLSSPNLQRTQSNFTKAPTNKENIPKLL